MTLTRQQIHKKTGISVITLYNYDRGYYVKDGQPVWYYDDHRTLKPITHRYTIKQVLAYKNGLILERSRKM